MSDEISVVPLRDVPPPELGPGRPLTVRLLWLLTERVFVTNSLQLSSRVRVAALRAFGARIGERVVFRPRTRVRFPWNLEIGNDCWIGEGVWISNRDKVLIEHDVVVSQESFITTGSHDVRSDMRVVTGPVTVRAGAWITTRCIVLGGVEIGRSAVVAPGNVISRHVAPGVIVKSPPSGATVPRFPEIDADGEA
ncbi:acetyltransferase [Cellulomonas sp. PhB143]|uniref:acetyltransferase n=1 Tax=Cellulomonas sp. PhB143 TaxID=2485186 RepID=UPI000F462768|nr:acetyltransferase [Cellulomonas sp. PhB143]ROS78678.1 putative colanic acid biosynthesis acetyltransferase WcaF [Cellulomonas sp. PhB143]